MQALVLGDLRIVVGRPCGGDWEYVLWIPGLGFVRA